MAFPAEYEVYNENRGIRNEISPYLKTTIKYKLLSVYGDIQYRYTTLDYYDYTNDFWLDQHAWNFFNWSFGSTFNIANNLHVYYGIGRNHREPTRTDLFGGFDEYYEENYSEVVPEQVTDIELGFKYYGNNLFMNLNGYYMDFKNEIVLNGQVGPNSIVIHSNVAESYRAGIELDLKYSLGNWQFMHATSLADNTITQDDTRFTQVLSPSFISSSDIVYNRKRLSFGVNLRHNGESFIDFANEYKLPAYTTIDFYNSIKFHKLQIGLHLNNLTNQLYYTYGNIGFTGNPSYFQQAGINFLVSLKYKFNGKK
jgi:iron complex outermembrane receptor protein